MKVKGLTLEERKRQNLCWKAKRPFVISEEEEENEDDTVSITDASILRRQIQDLCQEGEDKGYAEGANDPIL